MAPSGKRIVVIGAGVGGAGVAALLQARGHSVTLLERNLYVGGKCTSLEKNGYVCDYAFHLYSMGEAGPLGEINRRVRGELRWLRARPMGKMFFQDRGWMTLPATLGTALPYLGLAYAKGVLRPSVIKMLRSSVRNFGVMGLLDTVAKIARADAGFLHTIDRMSMRDFLLQFTDDKTMHRIMGIFSFLLVVIPYSEASAGEMLWCLVNMFSKSSLGYPQGGAREIAGSYARAFLRDGGSLRQGCAVKRILVRDGKARGVETEEGEQIPADVVISNAGIKSTLELAGEDQFPAEYASYVKNLKYSRSANIIKYGLDCTLPEVPRYFFQYMPAQSARQLDDFLEK
ncbi:MAG TPA: FAD-dependent oxidoreductase, partial [Deltaproteobacteria bacterium]|nr:FAD-dependent oxidoreductase [Deltaproteobacteria bacterium]